MSVVESFKHFFGPRKNSGETESDNSIRLRGIDYRLKKITIDGSIENIKAALISEGLITVNEETFIELIKNVATERDRPVIICLPEKIITVKQQQYLPAVINVNERWIEALLNLEQSKDQDFYIFVCDLDD